MWNAGVPYILKQFIDVVSQPGMVFGFDAVAGYTGLLRGKKAAVIYTSAVYGPAAVRRSARTSRRRTSPTGCGGQASATSSRCISGPNLATADADTGRAIARAQAIDLAKAF